MMELNGFETRIADTHGAGLFGQGIDTLQVNLGLRCNQHCVHCHLDAGPQRKEMMDWSVMEMVLEAASRSRPRLVDLTGGAPELAPSMRRFVESLCQEGFAIQVRTNLTVLLEPRMDDLPEFFREHRVKLVGSLPCYLEENVCAQRGKGTYERSIAAIRKLNALGYGSLPHLPLNLVYNPGGPFLPPPQAALEEDYRRELGERFGITFTHLLTITNMALGCFREELARQHQEEAYARLLQESFNPGTLPGLMCRHQLSVGWDGTLYDCDFNLALALPVNHGVPDHVSRFEPAALQKRRIVTGDHCFGCTAGAGSSCAGSIVL